MLLSTFVTLFLAIFAAAVPSPLSEDYGQHKICNTSSAKLVLPDGQTNLTAPTGDPSFVLLGVGYQNYTCSAAGTFTSAGALAYLFDLSCLSYTNGPTFAKIPDLAFDLWSKFTYLKDFPRKAHAKLGEHFFQSNGNGGIVPVWDFRGDSAPNQPDAFVVAARVAGLAAPTGRQDIDWLQLRGVSGALATSIYRTHTRGGQPPSTSCTPGSATRVKYVSFYWLYGSTITLS